MTLQAVPAFNLHVHEEPGRLDDLLERFDELADANDHFEFFWVPHTNGALVKCNNRTDEPLRPRTRWNVVLDDYIGENIGFGALCRLGRLRPQWIPRLNRVTVGGGSPVKDYVEPSYKVFASPRLVHFVEMEYSIPRQHGPEALRRLREFVNRSGLRSSFPVEVRVTAADDIPLSTASGRRTGYIAVHVYRGTQAYDQYFTGVETIMDDYGGRPHWGKLHYQKAATLAPRYPRWDEFQAMRRRLDPDGRFANPYLDRVLGTA